MLSLSLTTCLKLVSLLGLAWSPQPAFAAAPDPAPETPKLLPAPAAMAESSGASADQAAPAIADRSSAAPDPRQVECVAKVILHEAGGQPGAGQVAVAQVIRARVKSGRFAADACGVVKQRGQFFDVDGYDPRRDTAAWSNAVAIATDALNDLGEEVAPGALFFHAACPRGMAGRVRVAQIGGNVFYR